MRVSIHRRNGIIQQADDLLPQERKVAFHYLLQDVGLHQVVGVDQNVPGTNDSPPRNFRMRGAVRFAQFVRRFPDHFKVAANGVQNHLLLTPLPSQAVGVGQDSVHALANMGQIKSGISHGQLRGARLRPAPDLESSGVGSGHRQDRREISEVREGPQEGRRGQRYSYLARGQRESPHRFPEVPRALRPNRKLAHFAHHAAEPAQESPGGFRVGAFRKSHLLLCIITEALGQNDDITVVTVRRIT